MAHLAGEAAQALLDDAVERLDDGSVTIYTLAESGLAEDVVMRAAADADLLVIARDSRHPVAALDRARCALRGRPRPVRRAARLARRRTRTDRRPSPSRSQAQAASRNRSRTAMSLPPSAARPAPPADRRLGHAPRPVLAPPARALRRHVHAARRPPRAVGRRLASRRRQAGLHRRPERAARGRGQRDPQAAAGRAQRAAARRPGAHAPAQGAAAAVPRRADAGLRRPDPRDRRARGRELADRRADRHPPAHAGADARDHHARGLRLAPRRAAARAAARPARAGRPPAG